MMEMIRLEKKIDQEDNIEGDLKLNPNLVWSAKKHCKYFKKGDCSVSYNERCVLRRDLQCKHYRDFVFPDFHPDNPQAKYAKLFPKLKLEYEGLYNVKLRKMRNCKCGNPLQKGKTYCSKCKDKKKLMKYTRYNRSRQ
jgi:hypothetical protein